jgi:RNA polymerase sigma factor (sigma-70 family)
VPTGDLSPAGDSELTRSVPGGPPDLTTMMTLVRDALLELIDREYHGVIRFLMLCGASLPQAQDATQEAFAQAWQQFTHDPAGWAKISNPKGWIRAVAYRKYQRPPGSRKQPLTLLTAASPDNPQPGPGHAELTEETLLVLDALRGLGERERAVMACHLDGFTAPEIAIALGFTAQQARDALKKARKILAAQIAPGDRSGGHSRAH